jgi:Ca2+-binding EF-hand superfamily protein
MLSRSDTNGNGMIEPSEMEGRGGFMRRMVERAGLDPNQPVSIDKLAASFDQIRQGDERNRDERNRDERSRDERSNSSTSASSKPATPTGPQGFGVAGGAAGSVPGFDTPLIAGVSAVPIEKKFDARVIEYVKERMLAERDINKNGVLERSEWSNGRWSTPPEEMDLNHDGILTMEELCTQVAKRFASEGSRRDGESRGESRFSGGFPGGGFGPPGGGFGPPGGGYGQPGGNFGSSGGNFGSGGDAASSMRRYAESLLRQYDRNRDGRLQREEWQEMRPEHHAADTNGDGLITVDELTAHLQKTAANSSYASRSGDKSQGGKRSYRISTPAERLPKGMPDWFMRNDLDADGQISMAEYATTWDDQKAAEFLKIDVNGDGIITSDEAQPSDRQGGSRKSEFRSVLKSPDVKPAIDVDPVSGAEQ